VDQELKAYLDEHFGRMEERILENSRQIEGLQEESRHTRVLIEGMGDKIRLIAEGVVGVTERLETHWNKVQKGFEDVKASIAPAYQDLDRRVRWLEKREERKDRDLFDVIHEEFGIPKKS
jgi:hypothetical protein